MNTVEIELDDGRRVLLTQDPAGGPIGYAVGDDRFADGWRPLEDGDEIARVVEQIAAEQAARAQAFTGGAGDDGTGVVSSPEPGPAADPPGDDTDPEDDPDA